MLKNSLYIVLCACFVFAGLGIVASNGESSPNAVTQQTPTPTPTPSPTPCTPDDPKKPCPSPSPTDQPLPTPTMSPTMHPWGFVFV